MRNKLIDEYGAYRQNTFTGKNGVWRLTGSESTGNDKGKLLEQVSDTFVSSTGQYMTTTRKEIDRLFEEGKIWV